MRAFFLTVAVVAGVGFFTYKMGEEIPLVTSVIGQGAPEFKWPPELKQPYPDLELIDQEGQLTRLSDYKGRPILIEPIGMSCPGCQAFCGAHDYGSYGGIRPQAGLESIDHLARKYGGIDLSEGKVVHVHLLLYNLNMKAPHPKAAKAWAKHFHMDKSKGQLVLAGHPAMIGEASYNMIPGFQLIDRDFILRVDSTGHNPRHNLFRQLLPELAKQLRSGTGKSFVVREY